MARKTSDVLELSRRQEVVGAVSELTGVPAGTGGR
jgi:hypothetical protein